MKTKKCAGCGWEYPLNSDLRSCRFCGTLFNDGSCNICGTYVSNFTNKRHFCDACYKADNLKNNASKYPKYLQDAIESYANWLTSIKDMPQGRLTEDQWIAACSYFGGCSMCGSEDISTRTFFVPFREGGKYAEWNVIPTCQKCGSIRRKNHNPFSFMDPNAGHGTAESKKNLQNIVDYLRPKIERLR